MKTFKDYLTEASEPVQLNEYDTIPAGWDQFSGAGGSRINIPKGNYQQVPSPDPSEPGTWYLLRPAPPTNLPFNPVKAMWWQPLSTGGVLSPQEGDDRMGTIVRRFVDREGNLADSSTLNRWLKSLPQSQFDAWADNSGDATNGGPARWEYEINPKYKNQVNKPDSSSVKDIQDRILAKDPNALPKFGADGLMGPETRAAMARLGIKESLELQRIVDLFKF